MNYDKLEGLAQALFEESGDALFLFDPETDQLLDVNATAQRLVCFPLRQLLRMPVTELFHFEAPESLQKLHRAGRETVIFHSQEGYYLRTIQDGVWIPVNLTITRLHVKPRTLGLITARDVRKQHEARNRLKTMEAELRRVLNSVSDCLWSGEIDEAGKCEFRFFSPVVEKITGYAPDFFLIGPHRWWSVVHPEDQPRWEKAIGQLRAAQPSQAEYRMLRRDGTLRWVRDSVLVTRGPTGRTLLLDGVLTDITERKKAEEALRESEERFKNFMDHSPAVAWMKDELGRYVYANRAFESLLHLKPDDWRGCTDFDLWPADVAKQFRANDQAVLLADHALELLETTPDADSRTISWRVFKFPFQDAAGRRFVGGMAVDHCERADDKVTK
jgi:two-component system, cell cycle sensor histidine kinase and response regulator CckA